MFLSLLGWECSKGNNFTLKAVGSFTVVLLLGEQFADKSASPMETAGNCSNFQAGKAITRKFLVEHLTVGRNNYFVPCWICKCAYSQRNEPIHDLSLAFWLREGGSHWSHTLIKLSYTFSRKNSHIHAWFWGWCSLGHFSSSQHSGSNREWTSRRIWFCKHVYFINITISDYDYL